METAQNFSTSGPCSNKEQLCCSLLWIMWHQRSCLSWCFLTAGTPLIRHLPYEQITCVTKKALQLSIWGLFHKWSIFFGQQEVAEDFRELQSHYYIICNSYVVILVLYQLTQNVVLEKNYSDNLSRSLSKSGHFSSECCFVSSFSDYKSLRSTSQPNKV